MCSDAAAPAWVTGPRGAACPRCIVWERALANPGAYVYLLGLYLGDGYIAHHPRAQRLRITLDLRYPSIINDACEAIREISGRTANTAAQIGCTDANGYSQHWTCVFPQAGPGPKHLRLIVLEPWQVELVRREPESLIRGLIHSDGCRIVHTVAGHQYVRYFFSNMSHDIRVIFRDACDQLGIRWTASSHKHTSIARRDAVAALDRFVGPKH